jgi:Rieske Fe-S protein
MSEENQISRRGVLCGLAVIALGFTPESAIAAGTVKVLANGKVEVSLAANPALRKVGGVVQFQNSNNLSIALIRTSKATNGFRALNLACTHEGVIVEPEGNAWRCRLGHRAKFDLNGKVVEGPARQALRTLPIKATKSRVVVG